MNGLPVKDDQFFISLARMTFLLCVLTLFTACGGGGGSGSTTVSSSGTGAIAFSVAWEATATNRQVAGLVQTLATEQLDCQDVGVTTVEAKVYDENGTLMSTGGPWPCDQHSGTIEGVTAGHHRKVVVLGRSGDGLMYRGEAPDITVNNGKTTDILEPIKARNFIPDNLSPVDNTSFSATESGQASVTFECSSTPGASTYHLLLATDPDFTSPEKDEPVDFPLTVSLNPGTYYWKVSCADQHANQGSWSETLSFTVTPVNISGTWSLYITTSGQEEMGPDCISINQYTVEDGPDIVSFFLDAPQFSIFEEVAISFNGTITDGGYLILDGFGFESESVFTVSGTTDGEILNASFVYDNSNAEVVEGTFRAVRSECKKCVATVRIAHHVEYQEYQKYQDYGYGIDAWLWDYIYDGITIVSATVEGPNIGPGPVILTSNDPSNEYFPWENNSWVGDTEPNGGDIYTFNFNYSDGTSGSIEATLLPLNVDAPNPIFPLNGTVFYNPSNVEFQWNAVEYAGYYRVVVFEDWGNDDRWNHVVWSNYPPSNITSIKYNADGYGQDLESGKTYYWQVNVFDNHPSNPDNYVSMFVGSFSIQEEN
jgi:hypothetical protein